MNPSRSKFHALGVIVLMGALAFAFLQHRRWEESLAGVDRFWSSFKRTAPAPRADARKDALAVPSASQPGRAGLPSVAPIFRPTVVELAFSHPELLVAYRSAYDRNLHVKYRDFFRRAGLSEQQVAGFSRILFEHATKVSEAWVLDLGGDSPLAVPDLEKIVDTLDASAAAALTGLLGTEGYARLQEYQRTMRYRETADSFAGHLFEAGLSITAAQVQGITALLAKHRLRVSKASDGAPELPPPDVYAAALAEARDLLSTEQFPVLQDVLDHQQAEALMRQHRLRRAPR